MLRWMSQLYDLGFKNRIKNIRVKMNVKDKKMYILHKDHVQSMDIDPDYKYISVNKFIKIYKNMLKNNEIEFK